MIVTIVHIKVLPDYIDLLGSDDDPARFVLYEAYTNEEAAAAHKETAHYLKWRETVAPWMAMPRKGIRYTSLQPEF